MGQPQSGSARRAVTVTSKGPSARPPRRSRSAMLLATTRAYVTGLVERTSTSLPMRCVARYRAINGRDRAFVVAGQAFTTVIPLLIILGAATGSNGSTLIADRLNSRFNLTGPPSEALATLFERPPGATGTVTLIGLLLLLFSLVSLTRSLQRTFEDAWSLGPIGVRGTLHGLTGLGLLLSSVLVLSLLAAAVRPLPAGTFLALALRTLVAIGVWLVLLKLLLSRRVGVRRLLPG